MATTESTGNQPPLANYYTLGRSGLRVSALSLGTMTFGTDWGWGCEEDVARRMFDRYLELGGNFIDTANGYTSGHSEEMLGGFMKESGNRDRIVLATKFTFSAIDDDPNGGGNGRKHMIESVEASLRRLQTDYIDLYWVHTWDKITPVEEVMYALNSLVESGKVRYIGLSDTPAWYVGRAQTLAELRGWERICALQLEYSLTERTIEHEFVPAALELGMGICPWSPLCGGLLAGKYSRRDREVVGDGRLKVTAESGHPLLERVTEKNLRIADELVTIAKSIGRSPAQVALNWITRRPGVVSTIIGATTMEQLEDNLAALEFDIPEELSARLEEMSRPEVTTPYIFFEPIIQQMTRGFYPVQSKPPWYYG
jgi:aryl-alcohol dehydrogenase-like predicted oxidoreductase